MSRLSQVFVCLIALAGLTSCIDGLSTYSIEYPVNNASYIGTVNDSAPNDDGSNNKLGAEFKINYPTPPSKQLKIALNGNDVGKYFTQGPAQAAADIENIKQFFHQGRNTLSVEALSFGPQVVFFLDAEGPDIIITRGESKDNGANVEVEGFLRDSSSVAGSQLEIDLTQITGHDANGNVQKLFQRTETLSVDKEGKFSGTINIAGIIQPEEWKNTSSDPKFPKWVYTPGKSLLYTLKAEDVHGYKKSIDIIADVNGTGDSLPINNALRVAVGDTFVESLRPVIAAGLYTSLQESPIDQTDFGSLNPLKVDIGLGNMPTTINRFYMANGTEATDNPDEWKNINPGKGTMLLNSFKIKEGGVLAVNMVITSILADLTVEMPSWIKWMIPNLSLGMYIEKVFVETDAIAQAAEGKVNVQLGTSNFALQGIKMTKTKAGSLDITGLAGALMPIMEGLIGGLLPTIVNPVLEQNLSRIVLGQRLYRTDLIPADIDKDNLPSPDNRESLPADQLAILERLEREVPYTDFRLDVFDLATGNLTGPALPYDLLVGLQSKGDTGKKGAGIPSILGTYFNDDPIDPNLVYNSLGNTGTNISVAINSNLLNQFLAGAYSIGQMHLTLHNGNTYFGGDKELTPVDPEDQAKTLAKKGETRTRLWPDMPPIFKMEEIVGSGGTGKASITYPSAVLAMEEYDGSQWKTNIELHVDFDLAILIDELEGAVTLGAAGPPIFNINKIINKTNIQVPEMVIQTVLDAALFFGGDVLADEVIALNLNDIAKNALNGTQVTYLDSNDNFSLAKAAGESKGECAVKVEEGVWGKCTIGDASCVPAENILSNNSDGEYDHICQSLNFVVQTDKVGTIGNKGSNLFFQMGARDPNLPPAPAIPRFDLDDDGVIDYRDNCAISQRDLVSVIEGTGMSLIDEINAETGDPSARFEEAIRIGANKLIATVYGGSESAMPSEGDIAWYNKMRSNANDNTVADLGAYPWLKMVFSNKNQYDSDKDRIGELCENDQDRDGIYEDNLTATMADNCPSVYNPSQLDTKNPEGIGDACNARTTFVMLRSYKSKLESSDKETPLCLAQPSSINGDMTDVRDMLPCDELDPRQRFYMKAIDDTDLSKGVEFYNKESRDVFNDSRLSAFGVQKRSLSGGCASSGTKTLVQEVRLFNKNNTRAANINGQGFDSIFDCAGSGPYDRIDPVWYPRRAALNATDSLDEAQYPWYIDTKFNFGFSFYNEEINPLGTCLTYGASFGVDLDSTGEQYHCKEGVDWRWAIWVGGADAPWNGEW